MQYSHDELRERAAHSGAGVHEQPEHFAVPVDVLQPRNRTAVVLTLRMNFQNIFNRTEMQNPAGTNISTTTTGANGLTGGFGFINSIGGSTFQPPRQGTPEMRFQF